MYLMFMRGYDQAGNIIMSATQFSMLKFSCIDNIKFHIDKTKMCYHLQSLDVERCAAVADSEVTVYMGIEPGTADSFQTFMTFKQTLKISKNYAIACTDEISNDFIHKQVDGTLEQRSSTFKRLAAANLDHVVINLIGVDESLTASTVVLDDY